MNPAFIRWGAFVVIVASGCSGELLGIVVDARTDVGPAFVRPDSWMVAHGCNEPDIDTSGEGKIIVYDRVDPDVIGFVAFVHELVAGGAVPVVIMWLPRTPVA